MRVYFLNFWDHWNLFFCSCFCSKYSVLSRIFCTFFKKDLLSCKGAFNNYVDRILPVFDPPNPAWTVFIPWAWTKTDIFWPPPLPHLVHVVIECPLKLSKFTKWQLFSLEMTTSTTSTTLNEIDVILCICSSCKSSYFFLSLR